MLGSHIKNVRHIFNINLMDSPNKYRGHIENVWKYRLSKYKNVLTCKKFEIEETQRGGVRQKYVDI
jgi:hypothetical protein